MKSLPANSASQMLEARHAGTAGHYPNDKLGGSAIKQAQLHSAPSPTGRARSQSVPHTYSSQLKGSSAHRAGIEGPQRHSYGHSSSDDGHQQMAYAPETPDPQEQRQPIRAPAPSSTTSQVRLLMYPTAQRHQAVQLLHDDEAFSKRKSCASA